MDRINIAITTFSIGLGSAVLVSIFSNLYHKWKKITSFSIHEDDVEIVIKNNLLTSNLSSITYFFVLSSFTFFVATNTFNVYIQLVAIYLICILFARINFIKRRNYKVVFNKKAHTIYIKSKPYSLDKCNIEISLRRTWLNYDITSYSLYLKNENNNYVFIYGYSIYKDIENLQRQLLAKMNNL